MAPPRSSSIQGGGGGRRTASQTAGSTRLSVRRSSRSSVQSNMIYDSTSEDESDAEAESSVDEHRRKDTEYHLRIQEENLRKAEERRAREKKERELERQRVAARRADKKKRKDGTFDPSSTEESDVENVKEVRKSPRKVNPVPKVHQVESKLLSRMKRFSQLPQELWEKRVRPPPQVKPSQQSEVDTEVAAQQSPSSDGSKENAASAHSTYSKTKRVSTAPERSSPRKKQREDHRDDDSFVNKALLTSTPYPGGAGAWKNGPSLPDPDMSPVTPQNKDDRAARKVIHTQKIKIQSQSRIPVVLPVRLREAATPSTSATTEDVASAQQKESEFADNEETPRRSPRKSTTFSAARASTADPPSTSTAQQKESEFADNEETPRRSPRKSTTFSAARPSTAAPPSNAQKNGTFNVTHGFGGTTARPKVIRTPLHLNPQTQAQNKNKSQETSVTSAEEDSSSLDQLPKTDTSQSKGEHNKSQSQEHPTGTTEKRSANLGARLRRSIQAAALGGEDDSSSDDEPVIPLSLRIRKTLSMSMSRQPKPLDSPSVTSGAFQPVKLILSKKSLPPSKLSQGPPKEHEAQPSLKSQRQSQQANGMEDKAEDKDEQIASTGVSRTSAIHQSPIGRPEKSGLDRRSNRQTTATAENTSAPPQRSSFESEENAPLENIQEDDDFVEKPRAPLSARKTRGSKHPVQTTTAINAKPIMEPENELDDDSDTGPVENPARGTRSSRATAKAAPVPTEPETQTQVKQPSIPTEVPSLKVAKRKVVAPPPPPLKEIPEYDASSDESEDELQEPETEPVENPARGTRSTRATAKAAHVPMEPEIQAKQPSVPTEVPSHKTAKKKLVAPPPPPSKEIPEVDASSDESEDELQEPETEPLEKPARGTRSTRATAKAASIPTEPEAQTQVEQPSTSTKVPPQKKRKGKVDAPLPPPLREIPEGDESSDELEEPETEPLEIPARGTRSTRANAKAAPVPTEPSTSNKIASQKEKESKGKVVAPPPSKETPEVDASSDKSDDELQEPETEPLEMPVRSTRGKAVKRSVSPETQQVMDETPRKIFKTKKPTSTKAASLPSKTTKPKKKPVVTLPARKRGRPRKQKSPSPPPSPTPIPVVFSSSEDELNEEPSPPKSPRGRGRPSKASQSQLSPQTFHRDPDGQLTASPPIPEPHHRGRSVPPSPQTTSRLRQSTVTVSSSQPIPESHHRSRHSIFHTSRPLPASQPLPGTSTAAAGPSISNHSSLSIRTKENRRRSIFAAARSAPAASSPPPQKKMKKNELAEKTPERYVGTDIFGNYHMLKGPDFVEILNNVNSDHGFHDQHVKQLGLRVNHFLEDFFTHHCEESRQPYGFIPFGDFRNALDDQCLVDEDCSPTTLLEIMRKEFPKKDWKKSEGILYPSRYSKEQDNQDYLFK